MSLSRSAYDEGAYRHSLRESLGPAEYIFQSAPTNKYACDPVVKEAESSELMGIDRKNSRCPSDYFLPGPDTQGACPTPSQLGYTPDFIRDEHTKVSNPPSTLRGKGVNRFKLLHENPQDKAISPFHFRIQDNLNARDNHRVNIPKPVEMKNSLPIPSGDLPIERYTFIPTPTLPVILPVTRDELQF